MFHFTYTTVVMSLEVAFPMPEFTLSHQVWHHMKMIIHSNTEKALFYVTSLLKCE